jgi:hydroxymethylpyrimidine pyrophosphatase-like HAD family hydrolase
MADIRLLVLDIDGTIAGQSNQVTPAVRQAIAAAQAQGIEVAIATGRMYRSAVRFHQAVGSRLPLMAYQGAWIQDPQTQVCHRHVPLDRHYALALLTALADLEDRQDLSIHLYIEDALHVRSVLPETEDYAQRSEVSPCAVGDLAQFLTEQPQRQTTKLLALSPDPDKTAAVLAQIRQQYSAAELYLTQSVSTFLKPPIPWPTKAQRCSSWLRS